MQQLIVLYAVTLVLGCICTLLLFRRCYKVVGVDRALVRSGLGPVDVVVGGGMLVFPVIHHLQTILMVLQPFELSFSGDDPLVFSDQSTLQASLTIWLSVDSTEESIKEAAQCFGFQCGEPNSVTQLYAADAKQSIRKAAKSCN